MYHILPAQCQTQFRDIEQRHHRQCPRPSTELGAATRCAVARRNQNRGLSGIYEGANLLETGNQLPGALRQPQETEATTGKQFFNQRGKFGMNRHRAFRRALK